MTDFLEQLSSELTLTSGGFLVLAIGLALSFEFVNGFHDTANAVATVIYTHSLKPVVAVIWSGLWNLIGVLTSTGIVAFSVVALLPAELVLNVSSSAGWSMVFALLISAILWNLGTWYLGLPASSSHSLIGAIVGVGLANSLLTSESVFGQGVNWLKAEEVLVSLLISPLIGFCCAALLLLISKKLLSQPQLYTAPETADPPPWWIRALLILTCTGVSFAHGSNDGQKGMGLIMLILVGIVPGLYALNLNLSAPTIGDLSRSSLAIVNLAEPYLPNSDLEQRIEKEYTKELTDEKQTDTEISHFLQTNQEANENTIAAVFGKVKAIGNTLTEVSNLNQLSLSERTQLRSDLYLISESLRKLERLDQLPESLNSTTVQIYRRKLNALTQFIPIWIKVAVAIALGTGTMIGWKRIVVTVGERIGKDHLTYGQGASAELVAMGTIIAADRFGLPVSTTHVLSSGVAGTMAANGSGIQTGTVKNILLAWLLTLPACMTLGGITFAIGVAIGQLLGFN